MPGRRVARQRSCLRPLRRMRRSGIRRRLGRARAGGALTVEPAGALPVVVPQRSA
ncbi:MAG: hypothetical protein AVDCRST_MAG38-1953 [uncultured Solirubrobacteraceae bacterium]|uniref:Uncharacterized protein n=1 Tax=uncultured Solirubrobacteraceae bacterium TaxID=1162706 RepID=A0A6J4RRR7_9ACTN|nr:MAG: hypothetical protein AVDCRST_MAG38-1953 [uncultured Solirubrobacteraceae bacterium]